MVVSPYLAVRAIHVLAGGFVLGGAAVLWLGFRVGGAVPVRLLSWFEAVFWAVLGAVVFSGLGNLVGFGVPAQGVRASALSFKLAVVLVVTVVSLVRTLAVLDLRRRGVETAVGGRIRLLYAATAVGVMVIVSTAGVLARG